MKLSVDAACRLFTLGLTTALLAGCGLVGGKDRPESLAAIAPGSGPAATGPAADYPMVLGAPFTVDGELYTPADTLNYDVVGYAGLDGGEGMTLAHRTMPLPSYVEVTSLATGKTILARVERRGPMTGARLVALSRDAAQQIGAGEGDPIRVRRVNPPEKDRVELRAGRAASVRMETPKSLVEVLRRKLPASGAASLRAPVPPQAAAAAALPAASAMVATKDISPVAPRPVAAAVQPGATPVTKPGGLAPATNPAAPRAVSAYPLAPIAGEARAPKPVVVTRAAPVPVPVSFSLPQTKSTEPVAGAPKPASKPASVPLDQPASQAVAAKDGFVVQAGAFSNRGNAQRLAETLGGYVSSSGKLFRVRTGPFTSRGQAEAALAKVKAAGYSDARVYTAG